MRNTFSFVSFLLASLLLVVTQLEAQVSTNSSPGDQLQQLTGQLQNSPDDEALRGRIIALALTLNPKPATPDTVTMAEGAAEYAFKNAQTNSDFSDAAKQYEKALLLAPWLAADYFNCGVAHEKAGENKEAIRSFKFYLLAAPDADDATAVKKRIGGLQYAEQKAEDTVNHQNSAAAQQAAEQQRIATQQAAVYQGLEGGVWRLEQNQTTVLADGSNWRSGDGIGRTYVVINGHDIKEYSLTLLSPGSVMDQAAATRPVDYDDSTAERYDLLKATFTSRKIEVDKHDDRDSVYKITISDDGQTITDETTWHYPGDSKMLKTTNTYRRIR
jgi:tetratricopeptide (TPR) repeat protein